MESFPAVVIHDQVSAGLEFLLQAHGMGGMRPNSVLMGLPRDPEHWEDFCKSLRLIDRYQRNALIIDCPESSEGLQGDGERIDVLWQGAEHGELMVLLGYLLTLNPEWRGAQLRILASLPPKGDAENLRRELEELLNEARIDATVHIYSSEDVYVTLARRTGNTSALIVQFEPPEPAEEEAFREWIRQLSKLVPDIIYVHSASGVSLRA